MADDDEGFEEPADPDVGDLDALEEEADPDVGDLNVLEEDDLEVDADFGVDDEAVAGLDVIDLDAVVAAVPEVPDEAGSARPAEDEDDDEDDDVFDPDDVEAGLDVILKDRLVVIDDDDDDEEGPDPEDRSEGSTKVAPKRPGEFVCESCFLLKHPSQLADPVRVYCRDCV